MNANKEKEINTPGIYARCINHSKKSTRKIFTVLVFTLRNCTDMKPVQKCF
jgi:hypothetical protein